MPQLVRHGPFQSHPCCYTSYISSRLPVSFVSLNPSNNPTKDIKSYNNNNGLIQSLCRGGNLKQAVQVLCNEPNPTQKTFELLIYSCAQHNSLSDGIQVHHRVVGSIFNRDPFLATKLINMYCELGAVDHACKVFAETREKTIYVWTAVFQALAMAGRGEELLELYGQMNMKGIPSNRFMYTYALKACVVSELSICPLRKVPNPVTMVSVLQACAGLAALEHGKLVHGYVLRRDLRAFLITLLTEIKNQGYVPLTNVVNYDLDEEEKERILLGHSGKLAVAFGLINTSKGETIRISNNLRLCEDCHGFMKFVSKFSNREILLRDCHRFHCFKDGVCSCGDYW
ncbi:hypothetical protein TSUD_358980 [Trifolium subterraneum]|uniref:DYW domain-containing protein n=1 Tax=Trifolium subterraneum TaxID=3900 RepID=A0A2Z6MNQ7_TRISU|nr:hypothetical protein TSUD_358980 [Trifolium subterraneum]